ncbi:hypothetical protein LINGRAPRIM_LOCUS3170, partial [Linum grandiflorum]
DEVVLQAEEDYPCFRRRQAFTVLQILIWFVFVVGVILFGFRRRGGDERADAEGVRHEHGVRTLHRDDEIGSVGACSSSGVESFG